MAALESKRHRPDRLRELFTEYSDVNDEGTEFISLAGLARMAAMHELFLAESQRKFMGSKKPDSIEKLKGSIVRAKQILQDRLVAAKLYDSCWELRLEKLEAICDSEEPLSAATAYLRYQILSEYTAAELKKAELTRLIPPSFLKITAVPVETGLGSFFGLG